MYWLATSLKTLSLYQLGQLTGNIYLLESPDDHFIRNTDTVLLLTGRFIGKTHIALSLDFHLISNNTMYLIQLASLNH